LYRQRSRRRRYQRRDDQIAPLIKGSPIELASHKLIGAMLYWLRTKPAAQLLDRLP